MSDELTQRMAAANVELIAILTDKRQIRITGYIYSGETPEQYNKRIDEFQEAIDRQAIRADVMTKEAQLANTDAQLDELAAHYESLVRLTQTGRKLTSQQKDHVDKYDSSVNFIKRQKETLRAAIEQGRRKLNGAA
jgi:hypothetical protein